jgi:phosphoglycolate phosphatase-like HAD superfamily hydrolase
MKPQNLIVFDMDGVLVDVSGSYRETVRLAAKFFFQGARSGEKLPDPLFPLEDLAEIKQSGGLNNDWDLTAVVIDLLFFRVKRKEPVKTSDIWEEFDDAMKRCDVRELAEFLKTNIRPLSALYQGRKTPRHPFVRRLYSGDVGSGNVIKQIFQEIYLGKDLFASIYKTPPRIYAGEGYIYREKLLIGKNELAKLSENNILAIATGRPQKEADIPLDHFNIRKYFKLIYTLDDCISAEQKIKSRDGKEIFLSKPNPFMLDAIADAIKDRALERYYLGDMPDDMEAASRSRSGFVGVGLIISAPEKENLKTKLKQAGADYIIEKFEDLEAIIPSN